MTAAFKLLDLYSYLEVSIRDSDVGWDPNGNSLFTFSTLILEYRIQLYISFALIVICAPMSIRAIMFIL